jgi:hypothetical protein
MAEKMQGRLSSEYDFPPRSQTIEIEIADGRSRLPAILFSVPGEPNLVASSDYTAWLVFTPATGEAVRSVIRYMRPLSAAADTD